MLPFIFGGLYTMTLHKVDYQSPVGVLEIIATEEVICSILFSEQDSPVNRIQEGTPEVLKECYQQLDQYFKGERRTFTFPYQFEGTDFQKKVWNALKKVPYGQTDSYKNLAVAIGNEKAVRALGSANGKNKLSIVIPCHRIIGANGKLIGYAGGLWRKEWLLQHEKNVKGQTE